MTNDSARPRLFVDAANLFSMHVPDGWLTDTSGQQGTRVIFLHPSAADGFRANVNVTVQELRALSPEEFLTLSRLQLKQLTGLAHPERDEPARGPAGGRLLEWTMTMGPLPLRVRQLIVFAPPHAFVVTATAPAARCAGYQADIQALFDSFVLGTGPSMG